MRVVIIGGRGNGTVVASAIEDCARLGHDIECVGFLNDNESEVNGYAVLGQIRNDDWRRLPLEYGFIFALSNVKQAHERFQILKSLEIPRERFATVIHPTAVVSNNASLGRGVVLMPHVVVGPNVSIGDHSQLYAQSFIGHDTSLGEMVFIANNASVGGRIRIEDGAHIGSNSSLIERIVIGEFAIVGLGAVILKDVGNFEIAVGNPGRIKGSVPS